MPVVCSVGTTDPWNAAGLGLDVRVLDAFGVRGVTVVAGVSAQGPRGVACLQPLDATIIAAQFAALEQARIGAYRIGALLDAASVRAVGECLATSRVPIVYDPVIAASNGGRFADDETLAAIRAHLLPHVTLATPNLAEARILADDVMATPLDAARAVRALGAVDVLVTGVAEDGDIVDVYLSRAGEHRFVAPRLPLALRGTGCMLAAAIAASLAYGDEPHAAIDRARAFVRRRLLDGDTVGGMRVMHVRGRAQGSS